MKEIILTIRISDYLFSLYIFVLSLNLFTEDYLPFFKNRLICRRHFSSGLLIFLKSVLWNNKSPFANRLCAEKDSVTKAVV